MPQTVEDGQGLIQELFAENILAKVLRVAEEALKNNVLSLNTVINTILP
jgi:hypothetical protein